jgi:SAM-dependent methyltransferase
MMFSSVVRGCRQLFSNIYRNYFSLPYIDTPEAMAVRYRATTNTSRTLDLGCGKTPRNPFGATELFGVDVDFGLDPENRILACDLGSEALPFPDGHFDFVTAFDLFEHIPRLGYRDGVRGHPFIYLMSEICRVLKDGGILLSDTPVYPRESTHVDPTHVNIITIDTFRLYFAHPHNWARRYGFVGDFDLLEQAWCGQNLVTLMKRR